MKNSDKEKLECGSLLKSKMTDCVVEFERWSGEGRFNFVGTVVDKGAGNKPKGYYAGNWSTDVFEIK